MSKGHNDMESVISTEGPTRVWLTSYLSAEFGVETQSCWLNDLAGYLITSPCSRRAVLVVNERLGWAEETYLLVHVIAHFILGHGEQACATILEPRFGSTDGEYSIELKGRELLEHLQAEALTHAILLGADINPSDWETAAMFSTRGKQVRPCRSKTHGKGSSSPCRSSRRVRGRDATGYLTPL